MADIKVIFDRHGADNLPSSTICTDLSDMEDRPWPEFRKGKPITARQLARLLAPFGITPGTIRTEFGTPKGYTRAKFEDAFKRYVPIPPSLSATPPQTTGAEGFSDSQSATTDQFVADEKCGNSKVSAGCGGVAAKTEGCADSTLSDGDVEEREAIQAIDGEAALCVHCGEFVADGEDPIPAAGGRVLHKGCYDAFLGFQPDGSSGGRDTVSS